MEYREVSIYQLQNGRFVVARFNKRTKTYFAPLNAAEEIETGRSANIAHNLEALGVHSFSCKKSAKRWIAKNGFVFVENII